jgi:hypothetical protein
LHKEGDIHYHVFLEFKKRVELFGSGCLDLWFKDFKVHGKYETVRKKENVLEYITKCDNFIAEPEIPYYGGELFLNYKDFLGALYKEEGLRGVKNYLAGSVEAMLNGGAFVLKNLEKQTKLQNEKFILEKDKQRIVPSKYFNFPLEFSEWFKSGRPTQAIVIAGRSGIAKTEGIKSFLESKGVSFLLIRNIHGLRNYDPEIHEAIIFDDLSLEKPLTKHQHISLSDMANHSDFRIIRDSVRLMAETMRIFTTNNVDELIPYEVSSRAELLSRYCIVRIDKSLFKEGTEKIDFGVNIRSADTDKLIARNRKTLALLRQDVLREEEENRLLEKEWEGKVIPPWEDPNYKDNYRLS